MKSKSNDHSGTSPSQKRNASTHLLSGSLITLAPKAKAELVRWCEGQLSGFPSRNVAILTLISLLCDIEEPEEVRSVYRLFAFNRKPKFSLQRSQNQLCCLECLAD